MGLKRVTRLLVSTMMMICGCTRQANERSQASSSAITLVPQSGAGLRTQATVKLAGANLLANIGILYNAGIDGGNACYLFYDLAQNGFSLVKDSGSDPEPLIAGASVVENSQCALAGDARAETKDNVLTLSLPITFKPKFVGPKNVYFYLMYKDGRKAAFQQEGTWVVGNQQQQGTPKTLNTKVVPSSGEGPSGLFKVNLSPADLVKRVGVLFNAELDAGNGCYISYNPADHKFGLATDAADHFEPLAPGKRLENGQCFLATVDTTRAEVRNNALTLSLPITFKRQFAGPRNIYVYVEYWDGRKPTFEQEGTWLVAP